MKLNMLNMFTMTSSQIVTEVNKALVDEYMKSKGESAPIVVGFPDSQYKYLYSKVASENNPEPLALFIISHNVITAMCGARLTIRRDEE